MTDFQQIFQQYGTQASAITLILYVITAIAQYKVFKKAKRPGWLALIPIVNLVVLTGISRGSMLKALILLIPGVDVIYLFFIYYSLVRRFRYGVFMGIVTGLIPPLGVWIIGLGGHKYKKI